jgi:hypothetical protein
MFLMSSQVKKSGQCQLRDKKHQYFSIVSLLTDSVIVDHAVHTKNCIVFKYFFFYLIDLIEKIIIHIFNSF